MSDMLAMAYLIKQASKTTRRPHEFEHLLVRKSLPERFGGLLLRALGRVLGGTGSQQTPTCEPKKQRIVVG